MIIVLNVLPYLHLKCAGFSVVLQDFKSSKSTDLQSIFYFLVKPLNRMMLISLKWSPSHISHTNSTLWY